MVPQKAPGKAFDFEKDAIEGFVEGGWVKADGTTLGGDDGIGVATIMAILQARDLSHGPIEALFTVDEEADGTGVIGLGRGVLNSRVLINLDGEKEGTLWIGSAGGVHVDVNTSYPEETVPAGMVAYALEIAGLQGGHSGLDIDKGHGSAAALLARLLWDVGSRFGVRVASLASGDLYNVIPRQATAALVVPADRADALTKYVAAFERTVRDELAATEPSMFVRVTPAALPPAVMATAQQRALVGAVYASPNGVTRMSDAVPGLVETSCNLGILAARGGTFRVGISVRSAVDSARDDLAQRLMALFRLAGAEAVIPGDSRYSAFRPNPKSAVLSLMTQAYKSRFGVDPTATAIHAGLEVSDIGAKHPGMDMISVGPTVLDVHSQKERVDITSVQKLYDLLEETLRRMPDRR
jgi:dipeptidase D